MKFKPTTSYLFVIALVALAACGGDESTPVAAPETTPVVVEVAVAALEMVPSMTRASGSVEPLRRVMPGTKLLGRVASVPVREGDPVARGQLLAKLESRDLEAAVAQAEAALEMARAQLDNARVHHERMRDLHGRGSVTDKALEDATTGARVAEAALAQAEANLDAARVQLGYAEVRSPLAGWLVAKRVEAGDMTAPGAPMFTVEDLSRIKVQVNVPEAEVTGLAEGGDAEVEVAGQRIAATVDRVVPAGDPASRTFSVQLLLDNPDGRLKSGMFARVGFAREERSALSVPAPAVVRRGQLEGLFVVLDDRATLRWIKTGRAARGLDAEARVEVLSGLDPGERYVVSPPHGLTDGAAVTATEVAP